MNIYINYIIYILFIFSFCLEAKRKNEPKKKNSLNYYTAIGSIRPLRGNMCFCLAAKISLRG